MSSFAAIEEASKLHLMGFITNSLVRDITMFNCDMDDIISIHIHQPFKEHIILLWASFDVVKNLCEKINYTFTDIYAASYSPREPLAFGGHVSCPQKIKYLLDRGYILKPRKFENIINISILELLYEKGYNIRKFIKGCLTFDVIKWYYDKTGEIPKRCLINGRSLKSVEQIEWYLSKINPNNFDDYIYDVFVCNDSKIINTILEYMIENNIETVFDFICKSSKSLTSLIDKWIFKREFYYNSVTNSIIISIIAIGNLDLLKTCEIYLKDVIPKLKSSDFNEISCEGMFYVEMIEYLCQNGFNLDDDMVKIIKEYSISFEMLKWIETYENSKNL